MLRNKSFVTVFVLLLLSCFTFGQSYQDWKWLHPTPQGNTLRWVKRFDANTWYAVGLAGTFIKTTDGGQSFFYHHTIGRKLAANQHANIFDAHFFDQQNGIAVGTLGSIARTTNGGVTFDTIPGNPLTTSNTAYQVYFASSTLGYIAASSGILLKTTDAGLTWAVQTTGVTTALYDVWASADGNTIVLATTSGNVRRSTDAGATWTAINTGGTSTINKLEFKDANYGAVAGSSSYCKITTDGGATWNATSTPTGITFYDIDFVGSSIYLTGNSYYIYKSSNNGAAWDTLGFLAPVARQPWTSTYYATDFASTEDTLTTVGAFGLMNHNTGLTGRNLYSVLLKPGAFNDAWISADAQRIIGIGAPTVAGSAFDQFVYSTDGGVTWNRPTVNKRSSNGQTTASFISDVTEFKSDKGELIEVNNSTATMNSIFMLDQQVGYAVGTNSAVYKTTNAGMAWDSIPTTIAAAQNLSRVFFVNNNVGFIISKTSNDAGTIWKTTDGAATWTQQSIGNGMTGTGTQLYGIQMLNENVGWVLNYTPRPYKTTDGGATWALQQLVDGFGGFLYDINMFDENNGFIVGSSGRLYKTTNSGANWDTVSIPTRSYALNNIHFLNATTGYIVGATGTVFSTTDAGATWVLKNTAGSTLNGLAASGINNGTVTLVTAGSLGYAFKNTISMTTPTTVTLTSPNGGETWTVGSQQNITWTASGVTNVNLYLSTDNGTTWSDISLGVAAASGTYAWTVPASASTQCKVKIADASNAALFDISNATFTITSAQQVVIPMSMATGWNMAAVSVVAPNMTTSALFSGSNASVFSFNNGYVAVTDLMNGKGYWVRYAAPATFNISGTPVAATSIAINAGWNMIGAFKDTVAVSAITSTPAGIVNSNYFGFNNGYAGVLSLLPGKGYWVRATQAGTLHFSVSTAKSASIPAEVQSGLGKIIITDKNGNTSTLYAAASTTALKNAELPPLPPAGTFDVRFSSNRNAELISQGSQVISIEGAVYPISIRSEGLTLQLQDKVTGGKQLTQTLLSGQSVSVSDASINNIEVSGMLNETSFALEQNYPNPFNPSTLIRFSIPEKSKITLSIYNQLGQKVATLADGLKEMGNYTVEFNGSQLSSGIYFYELKTEKNSAIKKLMLLK